MSKDEIALQITLKVIERLDFSAYEQAKSLPYEVYNSIYKNIEISD